MVSDEEPVDLKCIAIQNKAFRVDFVTLLRRNLVCRKCDIPQTPKPQYTQDLQQKLTSETLENYPAQSP